MDINTLAASRSYTKQIAAGMGALKGQDGFSPVIEESQDNTDEVYKLKIRTKTNAIETPNLKGKDGKDAEVILQDYDNMLNKPSINGVELAGNKTLDDLGITELIEQILGNRASIEYEILDSIENLPAVGEVGVIYCVPPRSRISNVYEEYLYIPKIHDYEQIGYIAQELVAADADFSNTSENALQNKVITAKFAELEKLAHSDCSPVGTIISFMGVNAPTGYLKCDGTIYNISQYQELANHFKSNFGSANYFGGNGSSTFAVPDLRGEFLRGAGTASRNTGSGANVGVHQDATILEYISTWFDENNRTILVAKSSGLNNIMNMNRDIEITASTVHQSGFSPSSNINLQNAPVAGTSRPTNTSVLYCIKYKKVVEIA